MSIRVVAGEPTLADPVSQACTEAQFAEPDYLRWCAEIREVPRPHRKQWEFCWILQMLERHGMLAEGKRGLGFGVGRDPLSAVMAAHGVHVTATDLAPEAAAAERWIETGQHAPTPADLNDRGICPPDLFAERMRYEHADMRDVAGKYAGYDFVWSSCALEHLGSLAAGQRFVIDSLGALKPGGIAVHTTEYNLVNGWRTLRRGGTVLYRRRDFERLFAEAGAKGFDTTVSWATGNGPLDAYVDLPPYAPEPHIKLGYRGFTATSFGIVLGRSSPLP